MAQVVVEEVATSKPLARFVELPQALHGDHPRFAHPVLAWERYRVDRHRNPYLDQAEVQLLLARRAGRPAGRLAAHVPPGGGTEGRFGFWACADDLGVATALVARARTWLAEQGCTTMVGPWSFEPDDEPGALVAGFGSAGTTGRPWRPPFEAELLERLGGTVRSEARTWRLRPPEVVGAEGAAAVLGGPVPGQAGPYADPRLVLEQVAAVPDVSPYLRSSRLRDARALVRRARFGEWEGCTVVRCDGDPAAAVPPLVAAAGAAGYAWVVAPWSPDPGAPPETVHRTYRLEL
jgi:hypothetical protein